MIQKGALWLDREFIIDSGGGVVHFSFYSVQDWGFFFYKKSSIFLLDLAEKAIFWPKTNTIHLIPSVQRPNYGIDLKVSANCEIYNGTRHGWRFLSYKKVRIETTNHS